MDAATQMENPVERLPDLVVSDLTMPEMDGFTLLEKLKEDPATAKIPVIVVSAKDLTPDDEQRLAGQTSSIWLKGAFATKDLVEHVVETLSGSENEKDEDNNSSSRVSRKRTPTKELLTPQAKDSSSAAQAVEIKKVVLIDDDPTDARLISRILQMSRPLEIKQVRVGKEAIEVIREEQPDLIILDLIIPDKNGFQILEELKREQSLDTIPVVVITAKDLSRKEREMLITNNIVSLWKKGNFNREKLIAHIQAQLE